MLLINNLYGEYDSETAQGRGANAASNVVKYITEGRRTAEKNAKLLLEGRITQEEALKNSAIEKLACSYIPYTEVNEETGELNVEYGLAFSSVYLSAFDTDKDGIVPPRAAGPYGELLDKVDPTGNITPAKFLAWLIFQDCVEVYNGIISPPEAGKALMWASRDPEFVLEKLKEIYNKLNLRQRAESFNAPEPIIR